MSLSTERPPTPLHPCALFLKGRCSALKVFLGALLGVLGASLAGSSHGQQALPGWTYVGQQASDALQVNADIAAAPGAQVQVSLLPVHTEWSAYVKDDDGSAGAGNYTFSGFGGVLTATVLSGDGYFVDLPASVAEQPWQTVYATFQAGSMPSTVQFCVQKADGSVVTAVQDIRTWSYSRTESALRLGLGTAAQAQSPGGQAQVTLAPFMESWDVFVTNEGEVKTDNHVSTPVQLSGGSLSWETVTGDGSFVDPPSTFPPDGGGVTAAYTMGTSAAEVRVTFHQDNGEEVAESITLLFTDGSTSWSFLRTENLVNVTLTSDHAEPNIPVGENVNLFVHADRTSWDVYLSSSGTTAGFNTQTSPAAGAWCSLGVAQGFTLCSGSLDGNGNAAASFAMQAGWTLAEASVAYDSSTLGYASLEFTPVDNGGGGPSEQSWHFDHLEATLSAQLSGSDSLTTSISYTSWEVWATDAGQLESRNFSTSPAVGATVGYGVVSGAGQLSAFDGLSDGNGCAYAQFTPAQPGDSIIQATATFAGLTATATLTVSSSIVGGGGDGSGGAGDNGDNNTGTGTGADNGGNGGGDNGGSGDGTGGGGDASGTGDGGSGDPNGGGGGGDTGGGSEGGGGGDSGNYPDNNSSSGPWQFLNQQTNIQASIITNSFTATVQVAYYSSEMWQNAYTYACEERNLSTSPAIGAQVGWVITQGDGSVGMCMMATDATGAASAEFMPGTTDSTVTVYISFAGCTTSTTVFVPGTPPPPPPPPQEDEDAALAAAEAIFLSSPEFQAPMDGGDGTSGIDPDGANSGGDDDIPPADEAWSDGSVVTWELDYISWSEAYLVEQDISYSLVETSGPITVGLYTFQFEVTYKTTFDRYRVTGTAHYIGTVKHPDGTITHIFKDSPCSRLERRNVRPEKSWPRLK